MMISMSYIYDCVILFFCLGLLPSLVSFFFFFNDTATTEIYTLSLHDALPIYRRRRWLSDQRRARVYPAGPWHRQRARRSEEHTSELQSQSNLVCRLLLEKKKTKNKNDNIHNKKTVISLCTSKHSLYSSNNTSP